MTKNWIYLTAVLALLAGAAIGFGVGIQINPQTADIYLLNLGSVGDWVSGLGALGAIITTLWLADQQRRRDTEILKIDCVYSFLDGQKIYILRIASCGQRPSRAVHLRVASDHTEDFLHFPEMMPNCGDTLPKLLGYAEEVCLILPSDAKQRIQDYVENSCGSNAKSLRFEVMTTLGLFKLDVPKSLYFKDV
jgi:hypothetical protein